jgi:hypothetical protein
MLLDIWFPLCHFNVEIFHWRPISDFPAGHWSCQYWCRFSPSSVSDMTLWKNSCWNWAYFEWIAITQTLGFRSLHCPPRGLWIQLHWALHSPFQWMKWCRFTGEGYGVNSLMVRCSTDRSLPLSIVVSDAQCFCFCRNGCTYFQRRHSFQKPIQGYFCICW